MNNLQDIRIALFSALVRGGGGGGEAANGRGKWGWGVEGERAANVTLVASVRNICVTAD